MSFLSNLKGSATGSVDKAMLCIMKPAAAARKKAVASDNLNTLDRINTAGKKRDDDYKVPSSVLSALGLSKQKVHTSNLRNDLSELRNAGTYSRDDKISAANNNGYHVLLVKYNPSKLRITSHGGSQLVSGFGGENSRIQVQSGEPAEVVLNVELIFDEVVPKDAFMWDKFSDLSVSGAASSVSGVVKNVKGGGYSVQHQMEGLLGLVTRHETKQVLFAWGDMIFAGEIVMIDAKYTMFNPLGHPIRGVIDLQIGEFQDSDLDRVGSKIIDKTYWDKCYEEMLKKDSAFKKVQSGAGNLLNLR